VDKAKVITQKPEIKPKQSFIRPKQETSQENAAKQHSMNNNSKESEVKK